MTAASRRVREAVGAPIDEIVIVVPAHDEEALLGACLEALGAAIAAHAGCVDPVPRVVLVLDACVDGSAAVAGAFPWVDVLAAELSNVGAARALGISHALAASAHPPNRVWIANTDADSRVPLSWIDEQLAAAASGIGALIGGVRPDPGDLTAEQFRAWQERHSSHDHTERIHGANLGVRADAYLAVGGFPAVREHEDVMLVERLRAHGIPVASWPTCWVQTSARIIGRTPGGFAAYVRAHY